jgi:very-short-patch-repair endonuclease
LNICYTINRDRYVNRGLIAANYKVFRFLGSEINKDVAACVDQIEAYINEQKSK